MQGNIINNHRNHYFDFLRGIAIIMVIGNHTYAAGDFNPTIGFNIDILIMQIIKIAVPIFLAISGYFLSSKPLFSNKEYFCFLKKHLLPIYIPLIIFSLPFIFAMGLVFKSIIGRFALSLIGFYSVYYFIFLIAQYYILLPIIQRIAKSRFSGILLSAMITLISILVVTYFNIIMGKDIPLYIYAGPFPVWLIFFVLGCWIGIHGANYKLRIPIMLSIIGLILSYVESIYLSNRFGDGIGIKPSVFFFSAFVIIVLFSSRIQNFYNMKCANSLWGGGITICWP